MALKAIFASRSFDMLLSDLLLLNTPILLARHSPHLDARPPRRPLKTLKATRRADAQEWLENIGRATVHTVIEHAIAMRVAAAVSDEPTSSFALASILRSSACVPLVAAHWRRGLERFWHLAEYEQANADELFELVLALRPTEVFDAVDPSQFEQADRIETALDAGQAPRALLRTRPLKPRKLASGTRGVRR